MHQCDADLVIALKSQRLQLAWLQGAPYVEFEQRMNELHGGCPGCMGRMVINLVSTATGQLVQAYGRDDAIMALEMAIADTESRLKQAAGPDVSGTDIS